MKKYSLPVQLFKMLISLLLSWFIVSIVMSSIFVDEQPKYLDIYELVIAIVFSLIVVIIYDYNEICRSKSTVQRTRQDIKSAIEIRKRLIDKSERLVDKYIDKETKAYENFIKERYANANVAGSLKLVTESNPELKSSLGVQKLLTQLEDTERLILQSKNQYSYFVSEYNAAINTFPVVLVKRIFKWKEEDTNTILDEELVTDEELGI